MATDWHFGYQFYTEIVGKSNYQKALNDCYKSGGAYSRGKSVFVVVELVFETNNPFSVNAVMVKSEFGKIGYLASEDAIRYRHLCEGEQNTLTVNCKIFKGQMGIYGAWVDLDLDELPSSLASLAKYDDKPPPLPTSKQVSPKPTSNPETSKKSVSFLLGLGIFLFPPAFVWFTLRPGYSTFARCICFTWLLFHYFTWMS